LEQASSDTHYETESQLIVRAFLGAFARPKWSLFQCAYQQLATIHGMRSIVKGSHQRLDDARKTILNRIMLLEGMLRGVWVPDLHVVQVFLGKLAPILCHRRID
jgi:hypothetical protein